MIILVGDGAYAAVKLALCCCGLPTPVCLVSRLRLDARLYDFPPPPQPGKRGPKPKKGEKQTSLNDRIKDEATQRRSVIIDWYDGIKRELEIFSGISLWYKAEHNPVPIKWVVVRDPAGELRTECFFTADLTASAQQIQNWFVLRWNVETTFEEMHAHLGLETQRIYRNLHPSILDDLGLHAALRSLCREFKKISEDIKVESHFNLSEQRISECLKML